MTNLTPVLRTLAQGCSRYFPAGTSVATARDETAIERRHVGDTVLAEDPAEGKVTSERAQAPMVSRLRTGADVFERRAAAWTLGRIGDDTVVEALLAATRAEDPDIRYYAAESLGLLGAEKA